MTLHTTIEHMTHAQRERLLHYLAGYAPRVLELAIAEQQRDRCPDCGVSGGDEMADYCTYHMDATGA